MRLNKVLFNIISKTFRQNKAMSTRIIRDSADLLSKVNSNIKLKQPLIVYPDGRLYTMYDGIMLNWSGTNRYLKIRSDIGNEAVAIDKQLKRFGIVPRTIVDIGANFGEISLYFSRYYPESGIISVEASPENIAVLQDNLDMQLFSTANITLVPKALSDNPGDVEITSGLRAENSIVVNKTVKGTKSLSGEQVQAITLSMLYYEHGLHEIDFMKIDIEGAEPLLAADLEELLPNIKLILIEFSQKNTLESYIDLINIFFSHGVRCFMDGVGTERFFGWDEAVNMLAQNHQKGCGTDYYFFREETELEL
jgi:FkbM family methyltransferase